MAREAQEAEFEQNIVRELVFMAKEFGWTMDYIMDLTITQYKEIKDSVAYLYEQQAKEFEMRKQKSMV